MRRTWREELVHIYREANRVVDWIAKWGNNQVIGVYELISITQQILQLVDEEAHGVA